MVATLRTLIYRQRRHGHSTLFVRDTVRRHDRGRCDNQAFYFGRGEDRNEHTFCIERARTVASWEEKATQWTLLYVLH